MANLELNVAGIGRVLAAGAAAAELERRAARTVDTARTTGPRGHGHRHEIDQLSVGGTHVTVDGAVVDINWASHFWHLIEFGSANNPPYRPVTRAAHAAGLRIIDARSSR